MCYQTYQTYLAQCIFYAINTLLFVLLHGIKVYSQRIRLDPLT